MSVLRVETVNDEGMTLAELKDALRQAELLGVIDTDIIRVTTRMSWSANGAPIKRIYFTRGDTGK